MIPDGFLRRALKIAHKKVVEVTNQNPREFFKNGQAWKYDKISSDLMNDLGLKMEQVDELLGYLYENPGHSSDDYANMTTFKQPKEEKHNIIITETWAVAYHRDLEVKAYNPIMAKFLAEDDPGAYESDKSIPDDWLDVQDTIINYKGIVRN
jgi:hypothetical protein